MVVSWSWSWLLVTVVVAVEIGLIQVRRSCMVAMVATMIVVVLCRSCVLYNTRIVDARCYAMLMLQHAICDSAMFCCDVALTPCHTSSNTLQLK